MYVCMRFVLIDVLLVKVTLWLHTHVPKDITLVDNKQLSIMITFLCYSLVYGKSEKIKLSVKTLVHY